MGISGHYSEAWAIAPRLGAEVCRSRWKPVEASGSSGSHQDAVEDVGKRMEDREGVEGGLGGSGEVRKVVGKCGRGGKAWKVTVHYRRVSSVIALNKTHRHDREGLPPSHVK